MSPIKPLGATDQKKEKEKTVGVGEKMTLPSNRSAGLNQGTKRMGRKGRGCSVGNLFCPWDREIQTAQLAKGRCSTRACFCLGKTKKQRNFQRGKEQRARNRLLSKGRGWSTILGKAECQ